MKLFYQIGVTFPVDNTTLEKLHFTCLHIAVHHFLDKAIMDEDNTFLEQLNVSNESQKERNAFLFASDSYMYNINCLVLLFF